MHWWRWWCIWHSHRQRLTLHGQACISPPVFEDFVDSLVCCSGPRQLYRGADRKPMPQRGATVTCLVSFLNLQTRGRQREEGEGEGERSNKGIRPSHHPAPLIDGCREWERQWERYKEATRPWVHIVDSNVHAETHQHKHTHNKHVAHIWKNLKFSLHHSPQIFAVSFQRKNKFCKHIQNVFNLFGIHAPMWV